MSFFVHSVSAYQQLQNWSNGQANMPNKVLGSLSAGPDYSTAFANAADNSNGNAATLAANQALSRVQQKAAAATAKKSGKPETHDQKIAAQKAAAKAQLAGLGLDYSTMFAAPSKDTLKTSTGAYKAPVNPATGHGFAASSAATINGLSALNIFA
jgi:hypothetical protein